MGCIVGNLDGSVVGISDGCSEGWLVGVILGKAEGLVIGCRDGSIEGP